MSRSPRIDELRRSGRLVSFRDFMEAALYDPEEGYYGAGRVRFGARGDFSTSSTIHPIFGEVVAAWIHEAWRALGQPDPFTIVEAGPGDGSLARSVVTSFAALAPSSLSVRYLLIERSRALVARQRATLSESPIAVAWTGLERLADAPITGVLLSNELIDAMAVHRVKLSRGSLQELFVRFENGRWNERWAAPATSELQRYLERHAPHLLTTQRPYETEIPLDAERWIRSAAAVIDRGYLLTIDYGDLAERLLTFERPGGTIRAFRDHALEPDMLADAGALDLTASVNFSALVAVGLDVGLEAVRHESQREFLASYELASRIASRAPGASLSERLAMKTLLAPGGPSDAMRVLIQRKIEPQNQ